MVDDHPANLKAAVRLLESAGYEVATAVDGTGALQQIRALRPRLVLLDIVLPDFPGTEVLRQIRADAALSGIAVLLMSAQQIRSDQQAAGLDAGAEGYIVRPITNQELLARVRSQIRQLDLLEQLRASEARCRQAEKMEAIGTLAGGIAHDFNNILCSVVGYGNLAQQEMAGHPLAQEYLAEILKSANRAKDLVQQILTFSRQREPKREVIRLETVVKETAKLLRASLPADLGIEIDLTGDAPTVLADPIQIYQVIMNLGTNAMHAMEDHSGRLVIRLAAFEPDQAFRRSHPEIPSNHYTRLTVADTGHGMDALTRERIFEPFFTTKPVGKGTGLGLAIVHGIVKAHEGFITVASQPGRGTTFDLFFPAHAPLKTNPETPLVYIRQGAAQRILFLDDEPAITGPFKLLLERLNYQVTACNLPDEAIRRFRENPTQFDLVLTDLSMPNLSGLEVARQIHLVRPDLPVLLLTGHGNPPTTLNLREVGITELIEKPMDLTKLAGAVQRALATPFRQGNSARPEIGC